MPGASAQSEGALTQRVARSKASSTRRCTDYRGTPISPGGDTAARVFRAASRLARYGNAALAHLRRANKSRNSSPKCAASKNNCRQSPSRRAQLPTPRARRSRSPRRLKRRAHSGPFQESYASLQALLPQDANVLALEPLSRTGAPTRAELRDRFEPSRHRDHARLAQAQAGSGFWGRIQAMLAQWIVDAPRRRRRYARRRRRSRGSTRRRRRSRRRRARTQPSAAAHRKRHSAALDQRRATAHRDRPRLAAIRSESGAGS